MYKYNMSLCVFSTMGSGLSLGQILFSGNVFIPLPTLPSGNIFGNPTPSNTSPVSLTVTENNLLNGVYTISSSSARALGNSAPYAFNTTTVTTTSNQGWISSVYSNFSTFYIENTGNVNSHWLQVQFPYNYSTLHSYDIYTLNNDITLAPKTWYLLGSNNGSNWYNMDYRTLSSQPTQTVVMPNNSTYVKQSYIIKSPSNFNYIRLAVLESFSASSTQTTGNIEVSQFYMKGTAITLHYLQQLQYRFNSTQISGGTNLGNFATGTLVYDASLSNSNALTSDNTLALSNTLYVKLNKSISTDANGVSFSFSMKMSPDLSYNGNVGGFNPIFDIANGRGTDNIVFGILGNKIYTTVTSGNAWISNLTIDTVNTPASQYNVTTDTLISPSFSTDGNYFIYIDRNLTNAINRINIAKLTNNVWTFSQSIDIDIVNPLSSICVTANGNRIIATISNISGSNVLLYSTLQSNGIYTSPTFVTGAGNAYTDIVTTSNGNRVMFIVSGSTTVNGYIYYSSWNGSTYTNITNTNLGFQVVMDSLGTSLDGNVLTLSTSRVVNSLDQNGNPSFSTTGNNIYIFNWNNTNNNYQLVQTIPTQIWVTSTVMSHDTNYLFFGSIYNPYVTNNQYRISYLKKINDTSYATMADFSMSYIQPSYSLGSHRGIGLTPDQKNLYFASDAGATTVLRKIPISIDNNNTHYNIYNTLINDNVWRDYLWTIKNDGTYTYYVNGVQVYQSSSGLLYPSSVNRTLNYIGESNMNPDSYFIGEIDNFRMHNREISINELKNMMANVPNAPMYFYAPPSSITTNSATLTFVEPIQPVNFYDISAVPTSGSTITARISAPANTYNLTGLSYATYTASISAVNVFGRSSQTSSSFTITVSQSYSTAITGSIFNSASNSATTIMSSTIGTSQFTIEFWIYPTSSTGTQGILGLGNYGGSWTNTNGKLVIFYNYIVAQSIVVLNGIDATYIASSVINLNTWTHCAITRNSSNLVQIYINGILNGSNITWSTNFNNPNVGLLKPYSDAASEWFLGYISVLKISKFCFYTSNFSPLTNRFNNDAATILLLNVASSGGFLTDSSTSSNTFTNSGLAYNTNVPVVQTYSTAIAGSLSSGTNTYALSSGSGLSSTIGTSPFTIEFWLKSTSSIGVQGILGLGQYSGGTTTNGRMTIFYNLSAGRITVVNASNFQEVKSTTISTNTWTHCAIVRNSANLVQIYINGVLSTGTGTLSQTWTTNFNNANVSIFTPYYDAAQEYFKGFISALKISKAAFYNSNFTPNKSQFNNDGATILLLNVSSDAAKLTDSSTTPTTFTNTGLTFSSTEKPV